MADQIENGTKIKALTDASKVASPEFLSELEREKEGFKLVYYQWLAKFFIVTATISMLVLISSSLALFRLAPMVTVEPFLIINQDASEDIVRDEPLTNDMSSKTQIMEMFIRQYVILRNTLINDPWEMRTRWFPGGMVNYLSSMEVFGPFFDEVSKNWKSQFGTAMSKEVEIISVTRQGGNKSPVWKVDFKTYELYNDSIGSVSTKKDSTLRIRYWTASVTAYFIKERMFVGRRLINPLGFTVSRYLQTEVEIF